MFTVARDRFAELLGVDPRGIAPPVDLDEDDYARVLTVHMAALVAVDAARVADVPRPTRSGCRATCSTANTPTGRTCTPSTPGTPRHG